MGRQDFFLSVAVFVQLSQPRTGGLVRAGSAMALSGRSRCISGLRANVCRRSLPSAAAAPENVGARPSAPSALSDPEITPLRSNGLPAARDGAADRHRPDTAATVRTKPLKSNAGTLADDADTNCARRSGAAELPPV